jgi:hypothetical protein
VSLVSVAFVILGIVAIPALAGLFLLKWGQAFPGFGRWAEVKLGRVSPWLGRVSEELLSETEQRNNDLPQDEL